MVTEKILRERFHISGTRTNNVTQELFDAAKEALVGHACRPLEFLLRLTWNATEDGLGRKTQWQYDNDFCLAFSLLGIEDTGFEKAKRTVAMWHQAESNRLKGTFKK